MQTNEFARDTIHDVCYDSIYSQLTQDCVDLGVSCIKPATHVLTSEFLFSSTNSRRAVMRSFK